MQPSDNTSAPIPTPPQPPKQSFWSKLFGKKPTAPVIPPHESLAPAPRLDDNPSDSTVPTAPLQTVAPQTDSIIGTPEAKDLSAPDQNGEVTALPIDVPPSIEAQTDDKAPTVQTVNQPAFQSTVEPVPVAVPTPPITPAPLPPANTTFPSVTPPSQPSASTQPPTPDQR